MTAKKVKWSIQAQKQYLEALDYIFNDSVQNAENFEAKLHNKLQKVLIFPESAPPDKFKINNNGSYRAFNLDRYIVSYEIVNGGIKILRVRHSSMRPKYH